MEFALFFTRNDQTVTDCIAIFDTFKDSGIQHFGFKDIGVDRATLRRLNEAIQTAGARSYMEVVSASPEACLRSAEVAAELGVSRLLGGTDVAAMLAVLSGTGIEYFPAPGRPEGHPVKLAGSLDRIVDDCKRFMDMGCAGVDLLAYRATDVEPLDLVRAARDVVKPGGLVVSGSVSTPARVRAIREAGADLFTVGNAVLDCTYVPGEHSSLAQARAMLADSRA